MVMVAHYHNLVYSHYKYIRSNSIKFLGELYCYVETKINLMVTVQSVLHLKVDHKVYCEWSAQGCN